MTMTTELHLRYADSNGDPIAGQVIAHFGSMCGVEISVHCSEGEIQLSLDEMHSLQSAFMEIDRVHKINEKTKGE